MNSGNVEHLLKSLGCKKFKKSGSNIIATCPFGDLGGHSQGDRNPSFSMSTGTPSKWKCWGANCRRTGYSARGLLYQLNETGANIEGVRDFVNENEERNSEMDRYKNLKDWGYQNRTYKGYSKSEWDCQYEGVFDLKDYEECFERLPQYAFERGITVEQALKFGIGYKQMNSIQKSDGTVREYDFHRLFFAVFNHENRLVGWSGRAIPGFTPAFGGDEPTKYHHAKGFRKEKYLYGEQHIDHENPTCFLVEGFMDVLNLDRLGLRNVLAIMGGRISDQQIAKLKKWFKRVIIFPHNDKPDDEGRCAGLEMAEDANRRISQVGMRSIIAPIPKEPRQIGQEFRPPSDPGEYLVTDLDWIFEMLRRQFGGNQQQGETESEEASAETGADEKITREA